MKPQDILTPNKNFQASINIDFDFGDASKVEELIPTDSVCHYLEEILRDVLVGSSNHAKLFVGAYGKGKSHIVLAALMAMWVKEPSCFSGIIEGYKERGLGFGDTLEGFVTSGRKLLPVIISGSTSDLRHSLLYSLRNALRRAGLEELMPQTNYDGALRVLARWRDSYPDTLRNFERLSGMSAQTAFSRLKNLDTAAYSTFVEVYPSLTSGSTFNALEGSDVLEVYEEVLEELKSRGIGGIYVVYDEFSKFLEANIEHTTIEDIKLLQDFAEACNRSGQEKQLHILLISHKSLANYIDSRLPKEKVDGWRGVSGRFREIDMMDGPSQYYELMSKAIVKDESLWQEWLIEENGRNEELLDCMATRYSKQGLFESGLSLTVTRGCFPLHPVTAYLLPRMSEKIAQNERTLFTFLCADGAGTLADILPEVRRFVSPDFIYDYFEPLLRNEFYASPLHRIYELVRNSLRHVDSGSLGSRIVKTIAAIDVVAQYDKVAPTRELLLDVYSDCGYDSFEVEDALRRLIENESIVYLRRSNSFLKLKESSGEPIDEKISNKEAQLRNTAKCVDILNSIVGDKALYPSRYNEEKGMVRYFDCRFVDHDTLESEGILQEALDGDGDGTIVAVYVNSPDDYDPMEAYARKVISEKPMTVAAFPKQYAPIEESLYRLEAARELKLAAKNDEVLSEEYEIVIEDSSEIVGEFIEGYFQPELGRSKYYVNGEQKKDVTRKRKLSEELSRLCELTYSATPQITSESLNKNKLTGTAYNSRTKILKALCAHELQPNLGFVGNGQETSMARSAFEKTGMVEELAVSAETPSANPLPEIERVQKVIDAFIESASDTSFGELYDELMGVDLRIGMRRGPIPLYLAYELRNYRDEVEITYENEERALDETLLNDIDNKPESYFITHLDWSQEKADYLSGLANIFDCNTQFPSRNEVVEAMKLWYAGLPQFTRNSSVDHTQPGVSAAVTTTRKNFFAAIRRYNTKPNVLLFDELPKAFGRESASSDLVEDIRAEKEACDGYLESTILALADTLKTEFDPQCPEDATLGSVLGDWVECHPAVSTHVFAGVTNQVLSAIKGANGDDFVTVNRVAKAATSLNIGDWNDARFDDFLCIVRSAKDEVERHSAEDGSEEESDKVGILSIRRDGSTQQKTFDVVECSDRSRLLKNSLVACLSEMGGSLRPEEKRQVVFEVLEELC